MKDPVAQRFSENLLLVRRRAGLSQEDLGFLACLHRTEISQLELGYREPKISTLLKLSGSLKVTPNDLLANIDWRPNPAAVLRGQYKIKD